MHPSTGWLPKRRNSNCAHFVQPGFRFWKTARTACLCAQTATSSLPAAAFPATAANCWERCAFDLFQVRANHANDSDWRCRTKRLAPRRRDCVVHYDWQAVRTNLTAHHSANRKWRRWTRAGVPQSVEVRLCNRGTGQRRKGDVCAINRIAVARLPQTNNQAAIWKFATAAPLPVAFVAGGRRRCAEAERSWRVNGGLA